MRAAGLGMPRADGEDCAVGDDKLLHAARARTTARSKPFICSVER